MALATLAGSLMEGLVVGIEPVDPPTLAGAALPFLGVSWLAVQVPLRRATRVDPVQVLAREA